MRVRAAVLILPFLLVPQLFPQCPITPIFSTQFRSTFTDLSLDGADLWTATSYGLALYDRGVDPPLLTSSIAVPGATRVVRAANGVAYAGSGNAIVVVQKSGHALKIVRSVDAGAQVNDLVITANALYAATASGLAQYDLLDWSRRALPTSNANVAALALLGTTLYAADGDASVEAFGIDIPSLPQPLGTFTSLARTTSVDVNNGKLVTSDGRQSELFVGSGAAMTKLATLPFGAASLAPAGGDAAFVAAADRNLNAFDLSVAATPIQIFNSAITPSLGTANRIFGMAAATNRLYVAGGDAGLLTYDTSGFAAPFPLRSYATGGIASIVSLGDKLYVPRSGGGVTEFVQGSTGALTQARSWDNHNDAVLDGGNNFLLTASGKTLTLWTLASTTPTVVSTATFRANVVSAVLRNLVAWAVLADGSVWTADLAQASPAPQSVAIAAKKPASIARSGNNLAIAEPLPDDGITKVFFSSNGDFSTASPATIAGVATAPIVLDGATAALYTFNGISLIALPGGAVTVVPQSSVGIARSLALGGTTLLAVTDAALYVFNSQKLVKQYAMPSLPAALSWAAGAPQNVADVATDTGIVTVALSSSARLPSLIPATNGNAFYKKVLAAGDRVVLFDGRGADVWTTAMQFSGSARTAGMIDVAATPTALYALFGNRTIAKYSIDGTPLSQTTINDAPDSVPLAIFAVGNAVWVSISRGCTSGGCQKSTLIYDAALSQTASFAGGAVDVAADGARAYAIVDLPSEVRAYDVGDATHPAQLAARAAEGLQVPVSISTSNGAVYVLGEKLYSYDAALNKLGEQLASYVNVPGAPVTYVDQRVRVAGGCAIVSGRAADATLYAPTSPAAWTAAATQFASPSTVRSLAQLGSTFYLLTDHSLEIWSSSPMPPLPRKRPVH